MAITLTRERNGCVAHIRYDNVACGNSFDGELLGELVDTLEAAALDPMCSVIRLDMARQALLRGLGHDLVRRPVGLDGESVVAALRSSDEMLGRIRRLPVPVVAASAARSSGSARLAERRAPSGGGRGHPLVAARGTVRFRARGCGAHHRAGAAAGSGIRAPHRGDDCERLPTPYSLGLVTRVVPETELETAVHELVETLAAVPGQALRAVVKVVESSLATGSADESYLASARTIVAGVPAGGVR
ncbi:hypothetical protein [Streptomyces cathayae]|uniref:STAS domain-containing protein n=1 Tax=Streptomyces cathayae TaxID=3031124 RepID=A0ABY8JWN4_9ACTN|nr:hypothetical protein [Streptomyces sp. HUAS 5]WGD38698.1 hypothetical protein PYS65_00005 [Streptomyces sp. HUAS 5]